MQISYGFHPTPLGRCLIAETKGKICYLSFAPTCSDEAILADLLKRWPGAQLGGESRSTAATAKRIFKKSDSTGGPIRLIVRGTQFQIAVWGALLEIPKGGVCTYADVARRVGRHKAVRAVGSAIGANPIAWLIPCHRVLRSDGGLGGYRWGLGAKQACLDFEKSD